jgi:hypothetical protein
MNNLKKTFSILTILCCALFAQPLSATSYTMQVLDNDFTPILQNDKNQIVGYGKKKKVQLLDLSTNQQITVTERPLTVLGFNNNGQLLLQSKEATYLWDQTGGLQDLNIGCPKTISLLNNQGKFCFQKKEWENLIYIWNNGEIETLSTGQFVGEGIIRVRQINDNDQLLFEVFREPASGFTVVDLSDRESDWAFTPFSFKMGTIFNMNNHGDAVGLHAIYPLVSYLPRVWMHDGATFDLVEGESIILFSINDARECVGSLTINGDSHAIIWNETDSYMLLNDCTANLEEGTKLAVAIQINNNGQIMVEGKTKSGESFPAILSPNED